MGPNSGSGPYPRCRGITLSTPARSPRSPTAERDLGGILRLARRGWWLIALAALAGALIAAIAGSGREAVYESQVRMLVGPPGTRLTVLRAAGQRGQTYAELVTSRPCSGRAPAPAPEDLRGRSCARDVARRPTTSPAC